MCDAGTKACLVVEDEALIRMVLAETLTEAGFSTYEAENATQAISILERHPEIVVVFTDIQMPGDMDGLQLSHYVRERWPPTIIVICSARVVPDPSTLPAEASFLAKPYEPSALRKILSFVDERLAAQ